jgi:hypothetical protein
MIWLIIKGKGDIKKGIRIHGFEIIPIAAVHE